MTEAVHTLEEAAEILRMPYRTLRDAVYQGRYPHRRLSERRRVMTDSDIAAVLEMTAEQPRPSANPTRLERKRAKENISRFLGG